MWMETKVQVKSKEGHDIQQYKFRPRAFEIRHLVDVDMSTFGKLANDNFSEWLELLSEDECLEKVMLQCGHSCLLSVSFFFIFFFPFEDLFTRSGGNCYAV